ncbi:hypothetical protein DYB32_002937 [Aphanomyces invadans]|uniref:Sulfotransferase domain-containing protein n=1 Tax=Aphanomyces invadans TaxID=157072 RepID=A0A418B215_9STRA|nr:hypothetical protein DYB32_002937 [Aphanomyces invadans]
MTKRCCCWQKEMLRQLEHAIEAETQLTFTPTINPHSQKLAHDLSKIDVTARLVQDAEESAEKKLQIQAYYAALDEPAFTPCVNDRSQAIVERKPEFKQLLQAQLEQKFEAKLALEERVQAEEKPFQPCIGNSNQVLQFTRPKRLVESKQAQLYRMTYEEPRQRELAKKRLEDEKYEKFSHKPVLNKVSKALGQPTSIHKLAQVWAAQRPTVSLIRVVEFAMKSEEIWNSIKDELLALSVQDVYMILNVVCLLVFVYYLACILLGVAPKEKKPDPTILKAYAFSHWWLWTLLGVANVSQRVFGVTMFAIPVDKLKELVRATPKEAEEFFGDPATTIELFDAVIDDLAKSPTLSPYGRYMVTKDLMASLLARKAFMEYVVEHPDVLQEKIEAPIVLTGLPRTGQHLLYNLLALDPTLRAPRHYESEAMAYSPVAPPKAGAVDSAHIWHNRSYHGWQSTYRLTPELYESLVAVQYMDPISFCDDSVIGQHVMPSPFYAAVLGDAARRRLLALPNSSNVYGYLRRYLQMLQTNQNSTSSDEATVEKAVDTPSDKDVLKDVANEPANPSTTPSTSIETSWLLKAPFHASHLPQLRVAFPDARVVVLHRPMTEVVPSRYSLDHTSLHLVNVFSSATHLLRAMHPALKGKALDKKHVGRVALDLCSEKAAALHDARSSKSMDVIDVTYEELVADPIQVVKSLYAKWNKDVTDEFVEKMQAYLSDKPKVCLDRELLCRIGHGCHDDGVSSSLFDPQGKYGELKYSLEEFGLTPLFVDSIFAKYTTNGPDYRGHTDLPEAPSSPLIQTA